MPSVTKNAAHFINLIIDGSKLATGANSSAPLAGMSVTSGAQIPQIEEVTFSNLDLTITDNGDSTGGFYAGAMLLLPSTRCLRLGAYLNVTINSLDTGLLDGTYNVSIGTTGTTDSTLSGTEVNVIPSHSFTVSSGTGTKETDIETNLIYDAAAVDTYLFFNIGVPDAQITQTADLNMTFKFRFIYLDLSGGD